MSDRRKSLYLLVSLLVLMSPEARSRVPKEVYSPSRKFHEALFQLGEQGVLPKWFIEYLEYNSMLEQFKNLRLLFAQAAYELLIKWTGPMILKVVPPEENLPNLLKDIATLDEVRDMARKLEERFLRVGG